MEREIQKREMERESSGVERAERWPSATCGDVATRDAQFSSDCG